MKYVDLIIPGGGSNEIALNFVYEHLLNQMEKYNKTNNITNPKMNNLSTFERKEKSRKLSVNIPNKIQKDLTEDYISLKKVILKNHIPLTKKLRQTAHSFFKQLFTNPDKNMIEMNLGYMEHQASQEIKRAIQSDFQITTEEVENSLIQLDINSDVQELKKRKKIKRIYFIKIRTILDLETAKKILILIKQLDDFPVYLQSDFINQNSANLICKNSQNTYLFSLFYLESGLEFQKNLPEEIQEILFFKVQKTELGLVNGSN